MKTRDIPKYVCYLLFFAFFHYAESLSGVRGIAIALYFALVFHKRNQLIIAPCYIGTAALVSPTLENLIIAAAPVVVSAVALFIHYKLGKRLRLNALMAYVFISLIPVVAFCAPDLTAIIYVLISFILAELLTYCWVVVLTAVIRKGLRFKLSSEEFLAFGVITAVFGAGLYSVNLFWYTPYYTLVISVALFSLYFSKKVSAVVGLAAGAGAALISGNPLVFFVSAVSCGTVALFKRETKYLASVASIAVFALATLVFGKGKIDFFSLISPAAAIVIFLAVPERAKRKLCTLEVCFAVQKIERGLVNRDRRAVSEKLKNLSGVFFDIGDILTTEAAARSADDTMRKVVAAVNNRCCNACVYRNNCKEAFGDDRAGLFISDLAASAFDNGKATILDTPPYLSAHCKKINGLISATNEVVNEYVRVNERASGLIEGRTMVGAQMHGVGGLLAELSEDVEKRLSFDAETEAKLLEELSFAGIGGSDVAVCFSRDKSPEVSIIIKETDCVNPKLSATVSAVLGVRMEITSKESELNNAVAVTLSEAPSYAVMYAERAVPAGVGAVESDVPCGDRISATRISDSRVMLILSDGMGCGEHAAAGSNYCVAMLENFYKAGFDHTTIVNSVGKLLSARGEEDFNALDIGVIDTRKGIIDFIKVGGRESFIVSDGVVSTIKCGSLPLGIIDDPEPVIEQKELPTDSLTVMVSDGVLDTIGNERMCELLAGLATANPDMAAGVVIDNFIRLAGDLPHDDASVLVARVVKAV